MSEAADEIIWGSRRNIVCTMVMLAVGGEASRVAALVSSVGKITGTGSVSRWLVTQPWEVSVAIAARVALYIAPLASPEPLSHKDVAAGHRSTEVTATAFRAWRGAT